MCLPQKVLSTPSVVRVAEASNVIWLGSPELGLGPTWILISSSPFQGSFFLFLALEAKEL